MVNKVNAANPESVVVNSTSVSASGSTHYFGLPVTLTGSTSVTWSHDPSNAICIVDGGPCSVKIVGTLYYKQGTSSYTSLGLGTISAGSGTRTYTFSSTDVGPFSSSGGSTLSYYVNVVATLYTGTSVVGSNSSTSSTGSFTFVSDTTGPTISSVSRNPSSPTNYDTVDITATISDSQTGVSTYTLEYALNGNLPYISVPFTRISGNSASGTYRGTIPTELVGTAVDYTISSTDNVGNQATPSTGSYTVVKDSVPPTVSNVYISPADGSIDDTTSVNVFATITDNYYVSTSQYTSYYYNGGWTDVSMSDTGSNNVWKSTIGPFTKGTTIQYKIKAYDQAGNLATSSTYSFYIKDSDLSPPTIDNPVYPHNPTENTDMQISVNVTDISGISSVTLYYSTDDVSFTPYTMTFVSGNTFSYNLGTFSKGTQIWFYIKATDNSLNNNVGTNDNGGQNYYVSVGDSDTTPPTISNVNVSPAKPGYQDMITIWATVSDSNGIKNVTLYYAINNSSTWFSATMTNNSGLYTYNLNTFVVTTTILFYIVAFDNSLNQNKAINDNNGNYYPFTITDNVPPLLTTSSDFSYEMGSNGHDLYWNATDLDPSVYSIYRNGTSVDSNSWSNDVQYGLNVDGLPVGTYNFTVEVTDSYNNHIAGLVMVTVVDTTSPSISHPSDVSVEQASDYKVSWFLSDLNPGTYTIYVDDVPSTTQNWPSSSIVDYNTASLDLGSHNVTILTFDNFGNSVSDQLVVTVTVNTSTNNPPTSTISISTTSSIPGSNVDNSSSSEGSNQNSPGFEIPIAILGLIGISLIFRNRKKLNK